LSGKHGGISGNIHGSAAVSVLECDSVVALVSGYSDGGSGGICGGDDMHAYQNICMGFVKSTVFRWSKLKFNKTPVLPSFYEIKGLISLIIHLIFFLQPQLS